MSYITSDIALQATYAWLIVSFIKAYSVTLKRERELVSSGEPPLPTSSYVFLGLEFVGNMLILTFVLAPLAHILLLDRLSTHLNAFLSILFYTGLFGLLDWSTRFVLTITKTLIIYGGIKKQTKKLKEANKK